MEGFLTFIFFAVVTIYILGLLGRLLLGNWIRRKQQEFAQRFGDQGGGYSSRTYSWGGNSGDNARGRAQREGEVRVQRPANQTRKIRKDVGEYVDFEEIKE